MARFLMVGERRRESADLRTMRPAIQKGTSRSDRYLPPIELNQSLMQFGYKYQAPPFRQPPQPCHGRPRLPKAPGRWRCHFLHVRRLNCKFVFCYIIGDVLTNCFLDGICVGFLNLAQQSRANIFTETRQS